jgi:putative oxidoreductase
MLHRLHSLLAKIGEFLRSPLLLVIRLYWGWQFFVDGKGKLQNLDKVAANFASWNIPMPKLNVVLAASIQCVCGLMLLAGLFSRFATLALIGVMCVAYATAERVALGAIFRDPDKFVSADPFLFLFASVIVFAFGPGLISLDAIFFREKKARPATPA